MVVVGRPGEGEERDGGRAGGRTDGVTPTLEHNLREIICRSLGRLCKEVTATAGHPRNEATGTAARLMTRMMATAAGNALKAEDPASKRVAFGLKRPIEKEDDKPHSQSPPLPRHK